MTSNIARPLATSQYVTRSFMGESEQTQVCIGDGSFWAFFASWWVTGYGGRVMGDRWRGKRRGVSSDIGTDDIPCLRVSPLTFIYEPFKIGAVVGQKELNRLTFVVSLSLRQGISGFSSGPVLLLLILWVWRVHFISVRLQLSTARALFSCYKRRKYQRK